MAVRSRLRPDREGRRRSVIHRKIRLWRPGRPAGAPASIARRRSRKLAAGAPIRAAVGSVYRRPRGSARFVFRSSPAAIPIQLAFSLRHPLCARKREGALQQQIQQGARPHTDGAMAHHLDSGGIGRRHRVGERGIPPRRLRAHAVPGRFEPEAPALVQSQALIRKNVDNAIRWQQGERLDHLFEQRCDRFTRNGSRRRSSPRTRSSPIGSSTIAPTRWRAT